MGKVMTRDDVVEALRRACVPTQAAWAKHHKISVAYVSDVLRGARAPGEAILKALGLVREETHYRRVG